LPCGEAAGAVSFGIMNAAHIACRHLAAVFIAGVLLQLFLAGAGVFSAGAGTAARESSALAPRRVNGMAVMLLALLVLAVGLLARDGWWRWALPLLVLTLLQAVLAIAGAAGGLRVVNAAAISGTGSVLAYHAWRSDRRRQAEPAPAAEPAASRSGRLAAQPYGLLPVMPSDRESVRSGRAGNGSGTGRRALLAAATTDRRPGSTLECCASSAYPRPMARDAGCGVRGG
jgi:hypothetical protein